MRKKWGVALLAGIVSLTLAACGGSTTGETKQGEGTQTNSAKEEAHQPVTIRMFQYSGNITDDEFKRLMVEPVKQKYPYITMEIVRGTKDVTVESLLASGDFPDLIFPGSNIRDLIDLKAVEDIGGLAKQQNFDLGRFNPEDLEGVKNQTSNGVLYALPFSVNFSAMYYNKDIFDKFAVPYPKGNLTWDQAIELAKQVARTDSGVTYQPLNPGSFGFFYAPIQLPKVDPKSNKANFDKEGFATALKLFKTIADLPGNKTPGGFDDFLKERTVAMAVARGAIIGQLDDLETKGNPLNWDFTSVPFMKEYPGIGQANSPFLMAMYSQGKHKDDAFRAIMAIMSDENQLNVTKSGRLSALKDKKFRENFGADLKSLKGKNTAGAFNYKPAISPQASLYENAANKALNDAVSKVLSGALDANSALRAAQEQANQAVAAEVEAKK
jgi:multiple sugar transport system substrate-binding protein